MLKTSMFRKSLIAAGITVMFGFGAGSALALPQFTVNETSVPGVNAVPSFNGIVTADRIGGLYTEVITFTPTGLTTGTFQLSLLWNAGQFALNNVNQKSFLGNVSGGYEMYALFNGTGTFETTGNITKFNATAGSGSLEVWIDPDSDTTFVNPLVGGAAFTRAGSASDYLIATGTTLGGSGTLDPTLSTCVPGAGINCGSFGTSTTFKLESPLGSDFFIAPNPFHNLSFQSGQLISFVAAGTQTIGGTMDVAFDTLVEVPEPGTLALLGLAFAGLGFTTLRRKS